MRIIFYYNFLEYKFFNSQTVFKTLLFSPIKFCYLKSRRRSSFEQKYHAILRAGSKSPRKIKKINQSKHKKKQASQSPMNDDLKALFRPKKNRIQYQKPKSNEDQRHNLKSQNLKMQNTKTRTANQKSNLTSLANSGLHRNLGIPNYQKNQIINVGENVSFAAVIEKPVFTFHDATQEKNGFKGNLGQHKKVGFSSKDIAESVVVEDPLENCGKDRIDEDELEWKKQRKENKEKVEGTQKDAGPFCTKCRVF